ncbi:MAG TPA: M15 family metallopeptidase [Capillimicrobium sp.]
MPLRRPARAPSRRIRRRRARALAVTAAVAAVLGYQVQASTSAPTAAPRGEHRRPADRPDRAAPDGAPRIAVAESVADGAVPDGTTVFDDEVAGVANLDPELLAAVRAAASDAAGDGVAFTVQSGWRSPAYQQHLLREAVAEHGSAAEASRWVASPETSAHVSGDAVDLGPSEATAWLSEHGAAYGLCQIYGNEPWHYELRPEASEAGCPAMYADPTQDPRMRR